MILITRAFRCWKTCCHRERENWLHNPTKYGSRCVSLSPSSTGYFFANRTCCVINFWSVSIRDSFPNESILSDLFFQVDANGESTIFPTSIRFSIRFSIFLCFIVASKSSGNVSEFSRSRTAGPMGHVKSLGGSSQAPPKFAFQRGVVSLETHDFSWGLFSHYIILLYIFPGYKSI